ncbi:glycosyltransferase family 2 protein [Roseovarius aestuariivivens]|uniref:glycosyltransferase family 2 protein n=1 Tax=Roseovarius aestuariivivens TaxID=1888910 RepID=UPI0014369242|nr:glycosyltransferase family 2 protein [Roseovarius aestuariivivens]
MIDPDKQASRPKVSVIVPVYNGEKTLEPSIRSLCDQKDVALEIILINDASTDATGRLIDALAKDHPCIIPVHLTANGGAHEARLKGLEYVRAPWVGFLDADDFARPYMFSTLLKAAQREDVDIVICGLARVDASREVIGTKVHFHCEQRIESDIFARFCQSEFGVGSLNNKLYRRDLLLPCRDLQFPWRQNVGEDLVFNLDCFRRARAVFLLPDILYEYVVNPESVTSVMTRDQARKYVEIFRAFALALKALPDRDAHLRTLIVDLYRHRFEFDAFRLPSSADLNLYEEELAEAEELIHSIAPTALANLALRPPLARANQPIRKRLFRGVTVEFSPGISRRLRGWFQRPKL